MSAQTEQQEFRFGLGHPTLEFLATLARRFGEPHERLATPRDLERWLAEAGIADDSRCGDRLLAEARALREAAYRVLDAARNNRRPPRSDVELVNTWAREPTRTPQLNAELRLSWGAAADPGRAALARIARSTVELLAGPELPRIRNCARPGCSLLFIDHSRPGRRRWCSMDRCGNRTKTARYRQRRTQPARGTNGDERTAR